jgi:hypothetical protein
VAEPCDWSKLTTELLVRHGEREIGPTFRYNGSVELSVPSLVVGRRSVSVLFCTLLPLRICGAFRACPESGGDRTLAEMRAETRGDETPAVVSFLLDENLNDDNPEGSGGGEGGFAPPPLFLVISTVSGH